MNLKDAQTLERSLRNRAGSLHNLSNGWTTKRRPWNSGEGIDIPQHLREQFRETSESMSRTARKIQDAIEEVMRNIDVDV